MAWGRGRAPGSNPAASTWLAAPEHQGGAPPAPDPQAQKSRLKGGFRVMGQQLAGGAGGQVVGLELHHLFAQPIVDLGKPSLHRLQLVDSPNLGGLTDRAEPPRVLRYHPHQLRWNAQHGELVIAADVLDCTEVILGRDLTDGDQLKPVLLAVRRVHEQVTEVARPLAVAHRLAQVIDIVLVEGRVGQPKSVSPH